MTKKEERISLYELYTNSMYLSLPLGEGEWMPYPELVKQDWIDCGKLLAEMKLQKNADEGKIEELSVRCEALEKEYLKLTRFAVGELPAALEKVTGRKWKFSHFQKFDVKENQWKLQLQINQARGKNVCIFSVLDLSSQVQDFSDVEELRAKLSYGQNMTQKEKKDAALVYFLTGDPQLSFKTVRNFSWPPFKDALLKHLKTTYVDMDLYNSFGPSKFLVKSKDWQDEEIDEFNK